MRKKRERLHETNVKSYKTIITYKLVVCSLIHSSCVCVPREREANTRTTTKKIRNSKLLYLSLVSSIFYFLKEREREKELIINERERESIISVCISYIHTRAHMIIT